MTSTFFVAFVVFNAKDKKVLRSEGLLWKQSSISQQLW